MNVEKYSVMNLYNMKPDFHTMPLLPDILAPSLLKQGTGMKQVGWERTSRGITASGDTMMRSLAQADVDLKRPTGAAASQQAVLEALTVSVSRAESSGDANTVEILTSMAACKGSW